MVRHPYTALFADRYPLFSIMMPRPQDITAQLLCHFRSDWPRFCREGRIDRAAKIIDVSSPTVYRWKRAGNLRGARGVDVLRVHDLTGIEVGAAVGV